MSSSNFSVGSVVYFLHNKTERVLPAQVMERIDRTTIDGSKSTYVISVPGSGGELKNIEVDPDKVSTDYAEVDLGNGRKARLKMDGAE